ncbi:hypothetical protein Tco_0165769, partial [Tanacetum coccineum]
GLARYGRVRPVIHGLVGVWPSMAGSGRIWSGLTDSGRFWPGLPVLTDKDVEKSSLTDQDDVESGVYPAVDKIKAKCTVIQVDAKHLIHLRVSYYKSSF